MGMSKVVEELESLKTKVSKLQEKYPIKSLMSGSGVVSAKKQIPWICRTLNETANALIKGIDPFGNPITKEQVKEGLKKLVEIVRGPDYITTMDIIYDGIGKPIVSCMDELEQIITKII